MSGRKKRLHALEEIGLRQRARRRSKALSAILILGVVLIGSGIWFLASTKERMARKLGRTLHWYMKSKTAPEHWWLERAEHSEKMIGVLLAKKRGVELLIQEVKEVSPQAGMIASSFTNVYPSVFENGASFSVFRSTKGIKPSSFGQPEICFVPRDQFVKY